MDAGPGCQSLRGRGIPAAAVSDAPSKAAGSPSAVGQATAESAPHAACAGRTPVGRLLDGLRLAISTARSIEKTSSVFRKCGIVWTAAAMLLVVMFHHRGREDP